MDIVLALQGFPVQDGLYFQLLHLSTAMADNVAQDGDFFHFPITLQLFYVQFMFFEDFQALNCVAA